MTGPEHFQVAEKLLASAGEETDPAWMAAQAARAQVHATLAAAAANVALLDMGVAVDRFSSGWAEVLG